MVKGWQAGFATVVVTLLTLFLVVLDVTDETFRQWWSARPFTTDTVGGILVVLITVLVVNQVLRIRQLRDRSRATAAQAAIVLTQAARATHVVAAVGDSGDRAAASDEVRTYLTMVLIAAPILIDARISRAFLEQAQRLGGLLAQTLGTPRRRSRAVTPSATLDQALEHLRATAAPLIALLSGEERTAVGDETEPAESAEQVQ